MTRSLLRRSVAVLSLAAAIALFAHGCGEQLGSQEIGRASLAAVVQSGPTCSPTGAHAKHAPFDCKTCHNCGGVLQFDPAGRAVGAGLPPPAFDNAAKTCSSVACHGIPAGTYTYFFPGGDGEPVQNTVSYGGTSLTTPSWYATGAGCTACHNYPRAGAYVWHSGQHGGGNDCQLCHSDAVSVNGVATGLSAATNCGPGRNLPCASLHANGSVDVRTDNFKPSCFGCH
jgi:predicted CxxxxCH...CXXCH cytochrome family protein